MTKSVKKNKTDRRIQRTRLSLRSALLELIKEKKYDDISIEDITERANVGRATFYLHYKDKEDLLLEEFSETSNEKVLAISQIPFTAWLPFQENASGFMEDGQPSPLLMAFQHIYENSDLYYILLKSANSSRVIERIRKVIAEAIVRFVESKTKTDPIPFLFEVPVEFFATFYSGALLSVIDWWLDEQMRQTPEEMTRLFQSLFLYSSKKPNSSPTRSKSK